MTIKIIGLKVFIPLELIYERCFDHDDLTVNCQFPIYQLIIDDLLLIDHLIGLAHVPVNLIDFYLPSIYPCQKLTFNFIDYP